MKNTRKRFWRVGTIYGQEGLWYKSDGTPSNLIHNKFTFCKNTNLPMPFDKDMVGYLSAVDKYNDLFEWFSEDDIKKLQNYNYRILVYESCDFKFKGHWLIKKDTALLIETIIL